MRNEQGDAKNKMQVEIFGQSYRLVGDSSSDYMRKVAWHVNEHMQKIAKVYPRLDAQKIAVLAAVNISDELHRLQQQQHERDGSRTEIDQYRQRYASLQSEYEKLKNEFDEWTSMMEPNMDPEHPSDEEAK